MPIIDFSARDVNRGKIITPGWYRVKIDAIGEAPSKDGNSINWTVEATILRNAEDGSTTFTDVPTPYWNFNSKAKGFMIPFFTAIVGEVEAGSRFELNNTVGKELDVFIENDLYEGRMTNRMNHKYRAAKG